MFKVATTNDLKSENRIIEKELSLNSSSSKFVCLLNVNYS